MDGFLNFLISLPAVLSSNIISVFTYIFPEYPPIGVALAFVVGLLFLIYWLKSGFGAAVKIAFLTLGSITFGLFVLHSLLRIAHVSV